MFDSVATSTFFIYVNHYSFYQLSFCFELLVSIGVILRGAVAQSSVNFLFLLQKDIIKYIFIRTLGYILENKWLLFLPDICRN